MELKKMKVIKILSLTLAFLLYSATAFGQGTSTGLITGEVRDAAGASLAGAKVVATNVKTNAAIDTTSGQDGTYTFRAVPTGTYNITVEISGFKKTTLTNVLVQVNEEVRVDAAMQIGEIVDTVTVQAEASQVNTTTSTLRTVIDEQRINELPLNGRDPNALVQLVAGVQPDTRTSLTSGATYPGAVSVSSNGGRGNTTNYVLDGGSNNDSYSNQSNPMPNPDALQEFSVQTNNFSAEYGRNLGAVVNAVTKSGTNKFHGSLFEYHRNDALNATNFFTPGKRDGLKRNQFGGTFGGPLPFLHFGEGGPYVDSGKDRTFFFFSYQGTRTRQQPADSTTVVPSAAMRAGVFTTTIIDPTTGVAFPGNTIPTARISPIAAQLLQYIPLPNDTGNIYRYSIPVKLNDDQYMMRIDHRINSKNTLYGRYWMSKASQPAFLDPTNYIRTSYGRIWKNTIIGVNDTHIFSSKIVNNTVFTYNKTDNSNFQVYPRSLASMGANYYNDGAPQIHVTVNGFFQLNTGDTNTFNRKEFQIANATRITLSQHYISVGGDYSYSTNDVVNNFRANGQWVFSNSAGFTGYSMADFLLGKFATLTQGVGEYKKTVAKMPGLFIQDDYKISRKLTLNLGLRWDPFLPYTDKDNKLAGYRAGQHSTVYPNAPTGLVYPGDAGFPKGGYDPTWTNFGPRVGFAYDVTGDGKTSIRGGYGIFYDRPNLISTNSAANQAPFGTLLTINGNAANSFTNPYAGTTNPFPLSPYPASNVTFNQYISAFIYADNMRNARLQSYNVSFERELMPTYILRIAYAGSRGKYLSMVNEWNPATYVVGATTSTTNLRRPLAPYFGSIAIVQPTGRSKYDSFQATLDKRFANNFSILASYTLSKSMDHSSENKQTGIVQINPYDISFDWGPSNFDHRHRMTVSALYAMPKLSNKVANFIVGGWNLSGILTYMTGSPFSVVSGVDNARTGTSGQLADRTGDPDLGSGRSRGDMILKWFNTAAYTTNALGTFGNSGRNSLIGPSYTSLNMGLHKNFAFNEDVKLQFRFEAFNALNNVNLNLPNATVGSSTFGRITTAQDPRILQLALRLSF